MTGKEIDKFLEKFDSLAPLGDFMTIMNLLTERIFMLRYLAGEELAEGLADSREQIKEMLDWFEFRK